MLTQNDTKDNKAQHKTTQAIAKLHKARKVNIQCAKQARPTMERSRPHKKARQDGKETNETW